MTVPVPRPLDLDLTRGEGAARGSSPFASGNPTPRAEPDGSAAEPAPQLPPHMPSETTSHMPSQHLEAPGVVHAATATGAMSEGLSRLRLSSLGQGGRRPARAATSPRQTLGIVPCTSVLSPTFGYVVHRLSGSISPQEHVEKHGEAEKNHQSLVQACRRSMMLEPIDFSSPPAKKSRRQSFTAKVLPRASIRASVQPAASSNGGLTSVKEFQRRASRVATTETLLSASSADGALEKVGDLISGRRLLQSQYSGNSFRPRLSMAAPPAERPSRGTASLFGLFGPGNRQSMGSMSSSMAEDDEQDNPAEIPIQVRDAPVRELQSLTSTSSSPHVSPRKSLADRSTSSLPRGSSASQSPFASPRSADRIPKWLRLLRRWLVPRCRALVSSRIFQACTVLGLMLALFLPDLWIVVDRPNNTDLDAILVCVLMLFLVELVAQSIGFAKTYVKSFFFWMDLLGAVSMLFDLSFLALVPESSAGEPSSDTVILKTARLAKLGVRAGRFTKLVKLLRFLPGMRLEETDQNTAKAISSALLTNLAKRVSLIIITLVIVLPVFSMFVFPETDWSMLSWMEVLETAAREYPDSFLEQVQQFQTFYGELSYYPFSLQVKPGVDVADAVSTVLPWREPSRGRPRRSGNVVKYEGAVLVCEFNFEQPNLMHAAMNMSVLCFIMVIMLISAMMLSNVVSHVVLQPLERLLSQVRKMGESIFRSVSDMAETSKLADQGSEAEEMASDFEERLPDEMMNNERLLLERVVQKLANLSQLAVQRPDIDLEGLAEGERAIVSGFHGQAAPVEAAGSAGAVADVASQRPQGRGSVGSVAEEAADQDDTFQRAQGLLENSGLSLDLVNSDSLNTLELDRSRNQAAALFFLGRHNHGVDVNTLTQQHFLEAAESKYRKDVPYHNWYHAVDTAHGVYRLMRMCAADVYMSGVERYALLASAICHDLAHPGQNNVFLAETAHELALRYNDKSPLENMHCALMFEIISQPSCNVFSEMQRPQFLEARKTCIEAILHTDNAHHLGMIKELQLFYEMNSDILDIQRDLRDGEDLESWKPLREAADLFRQPDSKKLLWHFFLHFADISNPMRPFRICRIWAWKIMDEFFLQGDCEKQLGLPVQALNDREKVNRPFSQVGFIEFLVSPLAFSALKVLPPLEEWAGRLVDNATQWHGCWVAEKPLPGEDEQKALGERIQKLQTTFLESVKKES